MIAKTSLKGKRIEVDLVDGHTWDFDVTDEDDTFLIDTSNPDRTEYINKNHIVAMTIDHTHKLNVKEYCEVKIK